ncbi:uncharacterized protein EI90DRAFT_3075090, partial [Cantharellus anzutake]|uniref:uncharacterized protein n=1 Tax=Cantharellus anzutake TaxID=1750568 RepID=UPI001903F39D
MCEQGHPTSSSSSEDKPFRSDSKEGVHQELEGQLPSLTSQAISAISLPRADSNDDLWEPIPAIVDRVPSVPGLHLPPVRLSEDRAEFVVQNILPYFQGGTVNQVMLFGSGSSGLPSFILELIGGLSILLQPHLNASTYTLLFPPTSINQRYPARQIILNLYRPGEGISPHVDLLGRFGDGIIVLSLLSGVVMDFTPEDGASTNAPTCLWLPPRSILVLEGEARYQWKHGIQSVKQDFIESRDGSGTIDGVWVDRGLRISCTIRWLLPGADQLGY